MCSTYYSAEQNFYYMFLQLTFLKVLLSRFHSVASNFPDGLSDAKEGQDTGPKLHSNSKAQLAPRACFIHYITQSPYTSQPPIGQ